MNEDLEKKQELVLKKSILKTFILSFLISIISLYIVQHFGKIYGGGEVYDGINHSGYLYTAPYEFENPINGEKYIEKYQPAYGIDRNREETYLMKLKDFYLPSLFGNWIHILILTSILFLFFTFFKKYKIKLK